MEKSTPMKTKEAVSGLYPDVAAADDEIWFLIFVLIFSISVYFNRPSHVSYYFWILVADTVFGYVKCSYFLLSLRIWL